MHHDVRRVEYVMPEWNALHVDEIDDAAIQQSIQDIAPAASDDKSEAKVFVGLHIAAPPQVHHQGADQQKAEESEYPAMPLEHAKDAPHIADMREVNDAAPLDAAAQWNAGIDQMTAKLRNGQN